MRPFTLVCASERHSHVVHCRWHYYLLDFCYFANALMLAHLWLLPHSALLHKARARLGCLVTSDHRRTSGAVRTGRQHEGSMPSFTCWSATGMLTAVQSPASAR